MSASPFQISIAKTGGGAISFSLAIGDVLYLLGANGTGKSSLVAQLFNQHQQRAKRISAHRQTWFESNTVDITARNRQQLENDLRSVDSQPKSRYSEWNAGGRAGMAIFDLIDAETMKAREIADLVRAGHFESAKRAALSPAPIQLMNELMKLSNMPIELRIEDGQKMVASKNGSAGFSVAELSDGERNAFLIAAEVLTAKPGALILIDEPERHLHRSIVSPLLRHLLDHRKDCAFIVSTHEVMLPLDTPHASTLLVRACEYQGQRARSWTADTLAPRAAIDETLKKDILGSRRKMIFIEGTDQSLDAPLYNLLFPQVSIVPKKGCRDVEHAVRGLRGAADVHWTSAWGIIDCDQRSAEEVARLKEVGVWALSHYSVESLYYHREIVERIAARQTSITGGDAKALGNGAIADAIDAARKQREHLVMYAVVRTARKAIMGSLPNKEAIMSGRPVTVSVDVANLLSREERQFDGFVAANDWDGLLTRYPLRESPAFDRVVNGLTLKDRATYHAAVLKLLQDDDSAVSVLRGLLGGLYDDVSA